LAGSGEDKESRSLAASQRAGSTQVPHAHQLDTCSGKKGSGFLLSQELLIHKRGNPGFPTLNHLMTTHFSMAPGMETEWLFADLTDFLSFLYTYGLAV
jgi:hypothetical protein